MANDTLHELIEMERDPSIPDAELTTTSLARRELMRGDFINGKDWADAHGAWKSIVAQQVIILEDLGYVFEKSELPRSPDQHGGRAKKAYKCLNPEYVPSEAVIDAAIDAKNERKKRTPSAQKKAAPAKVATGGGKALAEVAVEQPVHNGGESGSGLPALPGLGQTISIYAQVLNDDDSITIGLRNGTRKWMVTLEGVMET